MACCGSHKGHHNVDTSAAKPADGLVTVYNVAGMTCGHCEKAISEEITAIASVTSVKADHGAGQVTVTSTAPLDDTAVRAAVDEAGYELVGRI